LARTDRSLEDLVFVKTLGSVLGEEPLQNGWRAGALGIVNAEQSIIRAAADDIQGPFLCATVCDSDFAIVWFASPGSSVEQFFLHPDDAANGYGQTVSADEQENAVGVLLRWAGATADKTRSLAR
jgi:hypothetical protein